LLPGIQTFGTEVTARDLSGQNSPMENRVLAHSRYHEGGGLGGGLKGAELVRASLAGALRETLSAQFRQIEQIVLTGSDRDSKATVEAARNSVSSAEIMPMVDSFLAGRSLDLPPARRPINLDEDLSRLNP